ncbi:MAG: glutamate racemase [Alphaproteobacteria bacterium]|nr:glutamate racemase [Alphaproteobacteria bacterium]
MNGNKIGIFDSGLGGLIIARSLISAMPDFSFTYLGDTLHVPYGPRSYESIYGFAESCIDYLFRNEDCRIVIIACNTATIAALRKLQQVYLPANFPDRRILGIVIPTLEYVAEGGFKNIGLLATTGTINSGVYEQELAKLNPDIKIYPVAAPLLVPLIENDGDKFAPPIIAEYLKNFDGRNIDSIILGCTHYPHYKDLIRTCTPGIEIISQDEIIAEKLADYLMRHPEIERDLSRDGARKFIATDITESYLTVAKNIFGNEITISHADIP